MYKGRMIKIDKEKGAFMRDSDRSWMKMPDVDYVALTQVKMKQRAGGRGGRATHKYNAFCVYIKAGKLNILAHRGSFQDVKMEAKRISIYLGTEVKDMIPRNEKGEIEDEVDSFGNRSFHYLILIITIFGVVFGMFMVFMGLMGKACGTT